ncbi:hypothetical protein V1477_021238 [Vespula maculifrons]|uniref:Uncharacterized protein n=1 Tax=Vespula maculifrons TaxID=7453 RepID=A0ABD2AGL4_VESMC
MCYQFFYNALKFKLILFEILYIFKNTYAHYFSIFLHTHTECNNNCNFVFFITDMLITYLMFNDKNPLFLFPEGSLICLLLCVINESFKLKLSGQVLFQS